METCKLEEMGTQKISVLDQTQNSIVESDSFILDMERFAHTTDKDMSPNSRFSKMQRSLSRKGSYRSNEKRLNSNIGGDRDTSLIASSSPKGGSGTGEKSMVVTVGHTDSPQVQQHQITIMAAKASNVAAAATTTSTIAESKLSTTKRMSFKRSSSSFSIDPRRILLFFATLSSMGTMLLIYFTLYMTKLGEDDHNNNAALDW